MPEVPDTEETAEQSKQEVTHTIDDEHFLIEFLANGCLLISPKKTKVQAIVKLAPAGIKIETVDSFPCTVEGQYSALLILDREKMEAT